MDGTFEAMAQALKTGGLDAALGVLNARIRHRYSAVYRLEGTERLINLAIVDKLGEPCPDHLLDVPYDASFCQFVVRDGQFRTSNSALDARLHGHPYQGIVNSYHSVPLVSTEGRILGTVCHFDLAAYPLDDEDFELLRLAARVFATYVPRPMERTSDQP
jgi:GAF domain-containing protein